MKISFPKEPSKFIGFREIFFFSFGSYTCFSSITTASFRLKMSKSKKSKRLGVVMDVFLELFVFLFLFSGVLATVVSFEIPSISKIFIMALLLAHLVLFSFYFFMCFGALVSPFNYIMGRYPPFFGKNEDKTKKDTPKSVRKN